MGCNISRGKKASTAPLEASDCNIEASQIVNKQISGEIHQTIHVSSLFSQEATESTVGIKSQRYIKKSAIFRKRNNEIYERSNIRKSNSLKSENMSQIDVIEEKDNSADSINKVFVKIRPMYDYNKD